MGKLQPDTSFVRDGRPLADWLPQLVDGDHARRNAAANALGGMSLGIPGYDTDWGQLESFPDVAMQQERFKAEVRQAVEAPGFPKAQFVHALCLLRVVSQEDWLRRVERSSINDPRYDAFEEKLIRQAMLGVTDEERAQAAKRFAKLFCASLERDRKMYDASEAMQPYNMLAHVVFEALDTALLAEPAGLYAMLEQPQLRSSALEALARIGPPAIAFAPYLLGQLDRLDGRSLHGVGPALGAIARGNAELIDGILTRVKHGTPDVRRSAIKTLESTGPHMAGRTDEAVAMLVEATHDSELVCLAVGALASVGRDREDALARVIELASPRQPMRRQHENNPAWTYDAVMYERGSALSALSYFNRFADRVVPVLVEAMENFEEYDPDMCYDGDHGRVSWALRGLGPGGAPAVPALVSYLENWLARRGDESREWPKALLSALQAIGPAAKDALPVLERIATGECEGDPPDDFVALLKAIRGEDA